MDPELMRLLAAAVANNKGLSGTLNNLDNPLLPILAGVYDPFSAQGGQGGGGPLWSQYAGETDPILVDLMTQIKNGTNEYYLGSYIDALVAKDAAGVAATGYSPTDLKGLAKGLLKEYTDGGSSGSGSSKDTLSKAGYRSPLDLYSTSDMPIGKKGSEGLSARKKEQDILIKALAEAQGLTSKKGSSFGSLYKGFDDKGNVKNPTVKEMIKYVSEDENLKKQLPGGGSTRQIDPGSGEIYSWRGTQESKKRSWWDPRRIDPVGLLVKNVMRTAENVTDSIRGIEQPKVQGLLAKSGQLPNSSEALKLLKSKEDAAAAKAKGGEAKTEAYKKGYLRALAESGKTPLHDQLKAVLEFTANYK